MFCLHVYVHAWYPQKRATDLELELEAFVSHYMSAGNELESFVRVTSALNY